MNYLAVDVGGTYTKYAVIDDEANIWKKGKIKTVMPNREVFLSSIIEIFRKITAEYRIDGLALSVPGIVNTKEGHMITGGSISCISDFHIVEYMERKCGIPVTVANDAKCAAMAELWKGALKNISNAVVILCGTAVGGAVVVNRQVLQGQHFMAGEFSYVINDSEKEYDLSHILGLNTGIQRMMKYVADETGMDEKTLSGEKVFEFANAGNVKVLKGIRRYIKNLAVHIHNLQYILDPEVFAIGGGVSVQPLFLQLIREEIESVESIFPGGMVIPKVVECEFHNDANLIGAVYVHKQKKK